MATWGEVSTGGGMSLLPIGIRAYTITSARVDVNQRGAGPAIRELTVALTSTDGAGEVTVPLEPFLTTPDGIEMWERIFKTAAVGLGFKPSSDQLQVAAVVDEFARWVPVSGLVGQTVEAEVKHVESRKLKDDGTPFVNHRVTFRGIIGGSVASTPQPVPSFAGASSDEDPWI